MRSLARLLFAWLLAVAPAAAAAPAEIDPKLQGVDAAIEQMLRDWNGVGLGVGIVVDDRLIFARGYGYRDLERKLPFTTGTRFPIASNSKLFTAVAAGLLVREGKLDWDEPLRNRVPSLRFQSRTLTDEVTLRDLLAHRSGLSRHDALIFPTRRTLAELFEVLPYVAPSETLRAKFLYTNLAYSIVGRIIELQSGESYRDYVSSRIFAPLAMKDTIFAATEAGARDLLAVPYERSPSGPHRVDLLERPQAIDPAGGVISTIEDMSHWLAALMNEGRFDGADRLPADILKATLEPVMPLANRRDRAAGWREIVNPAYGMGCQILSYRGNLLIAHAGLTKGFSSYVSLLPDRRTGIVVFSMGGYTSGLAEALTYNLYERLLGLDQTSWSERLLALQRAKPTAPRTPLVPGPLPARDLAAYEGEYLHPAYGLIRVEAVRNRLQFTFHQIVLPLTHMQYDRFDAVDEIHDDEWSLRFQAAADGTIGSVVLPLDETEVTFVRKKN